MQTIGIISQKGGAGKTTLAVHIAVAAQQAGLRVAVIDLDPQGTARKWSARRQAEPEVIGDHAEQLATLKAMAAENGADLLVIDTAPNADRASLLAAKASDFLLIPCRPAAFDLEAIAATLDLAAIARKPAAVVINAAPHGKNGLLDPIVSEAIQGLKAQGVMVAPQVIEQRVAFSHAVNDGRSALEFDPRGKAAKELRRLFTWACQQAGMQTGQRASVAA